MGKQIIYNEEALLALQQGVTILAKAVKTTYGPKGRNVVLEKPYVHPVFTKDGITVANNIELEDPYENAGAAIIKEVASQTAAEAGDGTTTAIIIAEKLLSDGIKVVVAGVNPVRLKKGIEIGLGVAIEELNKLSMPVVNNAELINVATIAANHDKELGKLIASAFSNGVHSIVEVEEAKGVESLLRHTEGGQINGTSFSPWFVTDAIKNEAVVEDALVLVTDQKIASTADILPLLQQIADEKKPLLIIAKEMEDNALTMLVTNNRNHVIECVAAKPSSAGDALRQELEDLALLTGTTYLSSEKGSDLKKISIQQLGSIKKAIVGSGKIRIITNPDMENTLLSSTLNSLKKQFVKGQDEGEKKKISDRLTRLSGGVSVLSVGAASETEMKEKLFRTDDAVKAVRAALEEGTVPGGGISLLHLAKTTTTIKSTIQDEQIGINIFSAAITAPFIVMAQNAGQEPLPMISRLANFPKGKGYNLNNMEVVDMRKAGIIDPAKVIRVALKNAVSIAGELLKIKAVITEETADKPLKKTLHATRN